MKNIQSYYVKLSRVSLKSYPNIRLTCAGEKYILVRLNNSLYLWKSQNVAETRISYPLKRHWDISRGHTNCNFCFHHAMMWLTSVSYVSHTHGHWAMMFERLRAFRETPDTVARTQQPTLHLLYNFNSYYWK